MCGGWAAAGRMVAMVHTCVWLLARASSARAYSVLTQAITPSVRVLGCDVSVCLSLSLSLCVCVWALNRIGPSVTTIPQELDDETQMLELAERLTAGETADFSAYPPTVIAALARYLFERFPDPLISVRPPVAQ